MSEGEKEPGHIRLSNEFIWNWLSVLSGNDLKVYCLIKSYNPSWPSYAKLCEQTGLSRPSIAASIAKLKKLKLLKYTKGNSIRSSNVYQVLEPSCKKNELVKNFNQLKNLTTTSKKNEPELVKNFNSNKTNIIKLNNKTKEKSAREAPRLKILKGPIEEFKSIQNAMVREKLDKVSHAVQHNWVDSHRDKGIDWIKEEIVKGINYHFAKGEETGRKISYSTAITNWLQRARTPPKWQTDQDGDMSYLKDFRPEGCDGQA